MGQSAYRPNAKAIKAFELGLAMHQNGQNASAEKHYRQALSLDPKFSDALHHLGIIAFHSQRRDEAAKLISRAIELDPRDSSAYSNLGMVLEDLNKLDEALIVFNKAIKINSQDVAAHLNRGNVLQKMNRWTEALESYDTIIKLAPEYAEAHNNRGNVLRELKKYDEAIDSLDIAIRLNPHFAEAINGKGIVLSDLVRHEEAIQHHAQAIQIKPDYAEAFNNRGIAFMKLKLYELANKDFDHAIKLNPLLAQAYANRGSLAQLTDRYQIATSDFEKSLSIDPSIKKLIGSLLHSKMHRCDWNEFEQLRQVFLGLIEREECLTNPFVLLSVIDSLSLQKKSAEHEVRTVIPLRNTLGPISPYKNHQKIRLGFFSADLREHAVAYLTAELFEKINKNNFEIIVFSVAMPSQDSMTQRISSACDHFIEIGKETDEASAAIARKMEIDIAIDLGGFTKDNRLGIFSYRAAPIQISYIGYLGTTGAPYVDYILADKTLIPEQYRDFYSEKIAYLPSYQVNDSKRIISDRIFSRKEFGLPETGFIFCCFNNNYKLTPSTFDCWMRILNSTEGSSLLLHSSHIEIEKNLKNEANKRGVDPSRIFFCAQLPRAEYLARFRIADLFLDTLPYNAGTIASDALWAGLPVLTLMGQSFVSRMCASVLTSIDLPELITNTSDEFVNCAIELAHDKEKLQLIKNKIARNRHTTQLFDSELFCKNFEVILNEMHRRSLAGLSPDHILQ